MPDPETQELQVVTGRREELERELAEHATGEPEAVVHDRRADRAAYLKDKLAERARSEDEKERS
jgi:hypothetical protein